MGENAVLFVAYGECQNIIAKLRGFEDPDDMDPLGNALSGSSAAFFSAMVLCPTEHIKCQLQVRHSLHLSVDYRCMEVISSGAERAEQTKSGNEKYRFLSADQGDNSVGWLPGLIPRDQAHLVPRAARILLLLWWIRDSQNSAVQVLGHSKGRIQSSSAANVWCHGRNHFLDGHLSFGRDQV